MAEKQEERAAVVVQPSPAIPDTVTAAQLRAALVGQTTAPPPGPNATTDPDPAEHHFLSTDGRKINAYGEEIGSKEDKARKAAAGLSE